MHTPQSILKMIQKGSWLVLINLKMRTFTYIFNLYSGRIWQFKVLPFGLSTAPRCFMKLLAQSWHSYTIDPSSCLPGRYIDRSRVAEGNETNHLWVVHTLHQAGFVVNIKKSLLTISQQLLFLGMNLDSGTAHASLPIQKALVLHGEPITMPRKFRALGPHNRPRCTSMC